MTLLSSIFIAFLSGVLGLFCAGGIAALCADWYRVSSFEGKSGYFVIFTALLGGLAAGLVGLIAARVVASGVAPTFMKGLGFAGGAVLGIALIALVLCRLFADLDPTIDGKSLEIEIEVRCPKGFTPPAPDQYGATAEVYLPQGRRLPSEQLRVKDAKTVDEQLIVPATVPLSTSAARKFLQVRFNAEHSLLFSLPLRSRPQSSDLEWSKWLESGWDANKPQPPKEARFNLRYRVKVITPTPEPVEPTADERAAAEDAKAQAQFDAVPADAPVKAWLRFTQSGMPDTIQNAAMARITANTNHAAELGRLMLSNDSDTAAETMYLIGKMPQPGAALNPFVAEAGRDIIRRIRKFNASTPEQDPHYDAAADADARFSAWMEAVRALREKSDGDFIPELREILELSRVREDSHAMTRDVRRVASYYMKQWANVEPLPGDPPPR